MKLSELLEKDVVIAEGYETKKVTWQNGVETVEFDVSVKREGSVADFEFIHVRDREEPEHSVTARRIHRYVRLDGEQIPLETIKTMKLSLVIAIASVLPAAAESAAAPGGAPAGNS